LLGKTKPDAVADAPNSGDVLDRAVLDEELRLNADRQWRQPAGISIRPPVSRHGYGAAADGPYELEPIAIRPTHALLQHDKGLSVGSGLIRYKRAASVGRLKTVGSNEGCNVKLGPHKSRFWRGHSLSLTRFAAPQGQRSRA